MSLYKKTASELSGMLNAKQISATELAKDVFGRIDAVEGQISAYITLTKDSALARAKEVDEKRARGEKLSILAGIPVAIKDNISVKGVPLTCASKMLENYIPPFSATAVEKLVEDDAVITGKTNMDEFAMGSCCETSYYKKTRNPHNPDCVPGGSSGGSAAALAAGEAILALGSDTGGSVRLPAAYCGVVGLRPTYGAVSRYGAVGFASSLDQISPMGRCVRDVAMLFSRICGPDEMDAVSARRDYPDFIGTLDLGVKGKIIGVPEEYFGSGVDEEVKRAVNASIRLLEGEGAVITPISLPSTCYALQAYYIISSAEASSNLARFDGIRFGHRAKDYTDLNDLIEKSRSEGFGEEVKRRVMLGTNILSSGYYDAYYKRAALSRQRIREEFDKAFERCDCLITPTAPTTAIHLGESSNDPVKMYAMDICTVAVSIAGLPAISLPCGKGENGLPIGMQIIGGRFSEEKLFQTAYHYEQLSGGPQATADIKAAGGQYGRQ